jgi:hypothetical protein
MSSIPVSDSPFSTIMNIAFNPVPPKRENREYRYYHCTLDWKGMKCMKVNGPQIIPTDNNTKLLFVKSYFPEQLDGQILVHKFMPNTITIDNKKESRT